jgi:hypothetical protein
MDSAHFFNDFEGLYKYYKFAKKATILSESVSGKYPVAIALEFRDALDHVFRVFQENGNSEKEFLDARNHIIRAAYDAYEIVSSDLIIKLSEALKGYSTDSISKVFPSYYSEIRPNIIEIQSDLVEIRSVDKTLNEHEKCFETYDSRIAKLISYSKIVSETIPLINEEQNRIRINKSKEKRFSWVQLIIVNVVVAVIGVLLTVLLS